MQPSAADAEITTSEPYSNLGNKVGIGSVTSEVGASQLIVAAPDAEADIGYRGWIHVFDTLPEGSIPSTDSTLTIVGVKYLDNLGRGMVLNSDLDGDGIPDIAATAHDYISETTTGVWGAVYLVPGAELAPLLE